MQRPMSGEAPLIIPAGIGEKFDFGDFDAIVTAEPGSWVLKPRVQWQTFWNAGNTPCEIIEVISPAGLKAIFANS